MESKSPELKDYDKLIKSICSKFINLLELDKSLTFEDLISEGYVAFSEVVKDLQSDPIPSEYRKYKVSTIIGNKTKQRLQTIYNDLQKARMKACANSVSIDEIKEPFQRRNYFLAELSEAFRQVAEAIIELPQELEDLCKENKGIPIPPLNKYMEQKHGWTKKQTNNFWENLQAGC